MREIKFRGFDEYHKEWVYGGYYFGTQVHEDDVDITTKLGHCRFCHNILKDGRIYFIENEKSIGQYTGLKDQNGKEIYEGDILQCDNCFKKVDFESGEWYINGEGEGYGLYFAVMEFDIFEVVGNTYENPYLIKE